MFFEDHPNRRVRSARRKRALLLTRLGGRCKECGSAQNLEFDHINGKNYDQRKVNQWTRMKKLEQEADRGEIQILCRSCNAKKGQPQTTEEEPW